MDSRVRVVYLAHGSQAFRHQALFSALTLAHQLHGRETPAPCEVVVYCDDPTLFAVHGFATRSLTREQVKAWSGRFGFVHRAKMEMLRHEARQASSPIFFVDGDTAWTAPPDEICAALHCDEPFMHEHEGQLSAQFHAVNHARLRDHPITWKGEAVPCDLQMWNSGCIGLAPHQFGDLDEALELCDVLFSGLYQRYWVEQMAYSLVLGKHPNLREAKPFINHYWNCNAGSAVVLERFFAEHGHLGTRELAALAAAFPIAEQSAANGPRPTKWQRKLHRFKNSVRKRRTHWQVYWDRKLRPMA